jgi:hypothetical protein
MYAEERKGDSVRRGNTKNLKNLSFIHFPLRIDDEYTVS